MNNSSNSVNTQTKAEGMHTSVDCGPNPSSTIWRTLMPLSAESE